jgi:uncharacterized membrane protein (TIGR02234 family)
MSSRLRSHNLVELLVVAALALVGTSAYLTWVSADPGKGRAVVTFDGYDVSRAPVTMAIASVVAAVVLRLAGTVVRRMLGTLLAVMGSATVAVALVTRPGEAELATRRPELSRVLTDQVEVTTGPAPWLALAGGIVLLAAGLVTVLTSHRWRRPTSRYERATPAQNQVRTPETQADQWKAIDAGEDPTL